MAVNNGLTAKDKIDPLRVKIAQYKSITLLQVVKLISSGDTALSSQWYW